MAQGHYICFPLSFNELMQVELRGTPPPSNESKALGYSLEARRGTSLPSSPPAQRPCSATKLRASCFQHYPESSLQTGKTHPPWGSGFTCIFLPGNFYLLGIKREVYCAQFIIRQKFLEVNPEWSIGLDLLQVTGCNVHGSPLPWKLTAKFPLETVVLVFLFPPASSGMSFPSGVQIRDIVKMDWIK